MTTPKERSGPVPALDRRGEGTACVLAVAPAGLGVSLLVLSQVVSSTFVAALGWHFLLTALPGVWAYLQFRAYRTTGDLKRQEEALKSRVGAESLFAQIGGADPGARLYHVKRTLALVGDVALLVAGAALALHFFTAPLAPPVRAAAGSALCALVAFIAYVGGRYVTALGGVAAWAPVSVCGVWSTAGGIFSFVAVIAFAVAHAGWAQVMTILDHTAPFWFLLLAAEKAVTLLGRAYGLTAAEPAPGQSKLTELVGAPAGVGRSIGDALAYNFGVRCSWNAVRGVAVRIVAPFVLFALGVYLFLSCFAWIEVGHVGLVERFGTLTTRELKPGLHLKAPWPIDRLRVESVGRVRVVHVGEQAASGGGGGATDGHDHGAGSHGGDVLFLTPAWGEAGEAMGLLAVAGSVRFRIGDVVAYTYRASDPDRIMRSLFQRAVVYLMARTDPRRLFGPDREALVDQVRRTLTSLAAGYGLEVHSVSLEHTHLPEAVGPAFEEVARARAVEAAMIAGGEADRIRKEEILGHEVKTLEHRAAAEKAKILAEGEARTLLARALSSWWKQLGPYLTARLRMDVLREIASGRSKLILPENRTGVTVFEVTEGARFPFERGQDGE